MRRGNAQRYPDKQLSVAAAKGEMVSFLYTCRPDRLADVTVDDLVARHRVDAKVAEYELTIARQKRSGEAA